MAFQQVEIQTHRVPFGIRCVDSATRQAIRDGANISVLSTANVGRAIAGAVTPSGNFSFGRMGLRLPLDLANPGLDLRDWEYDTSVDFRPAETRGFIVLFEETQDRFLSCSFAVTVDSTNVETLRSLLLFSAPSRRPLPGLTVIRGQVKQKVGAAHIAAPFARIEANYDTSPAPLPTVGVSDERGVFALFLPPPSPAQFTGSVGPKYADKTANATLKFGFAPAAQKYLCVSPDFRMETLRGDQTAELAAKRAKGWRCFPDQASLLSQAQVSAKSVAVGLVGETFLRVPDNADLNDRSVWLA